MSPLLFLVLLITLTSDAVAPFPTAQALAGARGHGHGRLLKSKTYLSPSISLRPGSVSNKWYSDVAFPRGHLALKSFNGEVVDARGAPVPLHETYLHHWLVEPYYAATTTGGGGEERPRLQRPNAGVCTGLLGQYFGLGAETRGTATWVPDPYAVEIGDPAAAPEGYEERWSLNVHAIDTRGAADRAGCTECRCDLYNVTVDENGRRIGAGYAGGTHCCYDQTRCAVVGSFAGGEARELFLRYTVMWLDWSDAAAVVPVMIYILDVTDTALLEGKSEPECKVRHIHIYIRTKYISSIPMPCLIDFAAGVYRGGMQPRKPGEERLRGREGDQRSTAARRRRRLRRRAPARRWHRHFPARRRRPVAVLVDPDLRRR
jgi:hypothetical protein